MLASVHVHNFIHYRDYEYERCHLQGHSSLTPVHLYVHCMNFDVLNITIYFAQLDVSYNTERRSLNAALYYDVLVAHGDKRCGSGGTSEKSNVLHWTAVGELTVFVEMQFEMLRMRECFSNSTAIFACLWVETHTPSLVLYIVKSCVFQRFKSIKWGET